jgi:hypothetical protein
MVYGDRGSFDSTSTAFWYILVVLLRTGLLKWSKEGAETRGRVSYSRVGISYYYRIESCRELEISEHQCRRLP